MLIVEIIRWIIFLSFLLLIVEGVVGVIVIRRFFSRYERRHTELEVRLEAVERRLALITEHKNDLDAGTHHP